MLIDILYVISIISIPIAVIGAFAGWIVGKWPGRSYISNFLRGGIAGGCGLILCFCSYYLIERIRDNLHDYHTNSSNIVSSSVIEKQNDTNSQEISFSKKVKNDPPPPCFSEHQNSGPGILVDSQKTIDIRINSQTIQQGQESNYKEQISIGILGHIDHGKTTLTAALDKIMSELYGGTFKTYAQLNEGCEQKYQDISFVRSYVEYESALRQYKHFDFLSYSDFVIGLTSGAVKLDGAIVVIAATDGAMSQTKEQIMIAHQLGIPALIVFLNKVDLVDDIELIELVEMETRELLDSYGYPGDDTPIITGSALAALENRRYEIGKNQIIKLMEALDNYVPTPGSH